MKGLNVKTMQAIKNGYMERILDAYTGRGEFRSCDVMELLGLSMSSASDYLREMAKAGTLHDREEAGHGRGRYKVYRVAMVNLRHQRLANIENGAVMGCHRGER